MARVLVISDCHLKPWMYQCAEVIADKRDLGIDFIVSLMDIPDDHGQFLNLERYQDTYNAVLHLAQKYKEKAIFVWGNHDFAYYKNLRCSGYSSAAHSIVTRSLSRLMCETDIKMIARIDNILFSHGGLKKSFVDAYIDYCDNDDIDEILNYLNNLQDIDYWQDFSPLWWRPSYESDPIGFRQDKYVQVVGHTPCNSINRKNNIISCDVFSLRKDGSKIGSEEFIIIDTITTEYECIPVKNVNYL